MADNSVFIAGVADGAFEKALGELPGWATDKTAKSIEQILKKSLGIQSSMLSTAIECCAGKGSGKIPVEELEKVKNSLTSLFKSLDDANSQANAATTTKKRILDDEKDSSAKSKLMSYLGTKALGGLVAMGGKLLGIQKQYYDTSNDLFKSGINLLNGNDSTTSSFISLNQMITLTGVRLEVFEKAVAKYSSSVNAVGVKKFATTINLAGKELANMGYKSTEWGDVVGAMIERDSAYSDQRGKSEAELASNAERYGKQLKNLALLTGQSIDKIKESSVALSSNSDIMAVEAEHGQKGAERINELASALPHASEAIMSLASSSSQANEAMYQSLVKAGAGTEADRFKNIINDLANGTISTETAIRQMGETARNLNSSQIKALRLQKTAGNPDAKVAQDFIAGFRKIANNTSQATQDQLDAATKNQASIANFSKEVEEALAAPQRAAPLLEAQLDTATEGLKRFNEAINSLISSTALETRSQLAIGLEIASAVLGLAVATGILKNAARGLQGLIGAGKGGPGLPGSPGGKGGKFGRLAGGAAGVAAGVGTGLAVGAIVDGIAGAAGVGNKTLDEKEDTANWEKMDILQKTESGIARTIEGVGRLVFLDNMSNEAAARRIKAETDYFKASQQKIKEKSEEQARPGKQKEQEKLLEMNTAQIKALRLQSAAGDANATQILQALADAKSAQMSKPKEQAKILDPKDPTKISVPTTPALSTVNSPGVITPETAAGVKSSSEVPATTESIMGPVMEKPIGSKDINTLLRHNSDILEQILVASNRLVGVNEGILNVVRNQ